ncbi:keratin-associated protein 13-1-like [Ursus americanus]|uniref:Keratin-associated protein n=1 Tax=Ursus maritimus TaxID=29073 RepID=A0A384CZU7_URSMA|nr:keratin-associated protein 13-1-like [Ursus maritimus]XP_045641647.1 keratin-associated protein 13-1-like [Ursus americanus]
MSYSCCSRNFSSSSFGGYLRSPSSSCGSSCPSNLVYRTNPCSPSTCQLSSAPSSGCQETCCEPTSCQTSCVVSRPCQTSCDRPRTSTLCTPCQTTCSGSVGIGSHSCRSLGYGTRSGYSLGCRSQGFRSLGVCGFPSLGCGSRFWHPTYLASRSCQSSCYRPTCGSGFF